MANSRGSFCALSSALSRAREIGWWKECCGLIGWFIPRTPLPLRALPGTPSVAVGVRSGAGVTWCLDGDHVVLLTMAGSGLWWCTGYGMTAIDMWFYKVFCAFDGARITTDGTTFVCDCNRKTRRVKYSQCFHEIVHLMAVNPLSLTDEETARRARRCFTGICGRFKKFSGLVKVRSKVCVVK
uniref:Uncharacterized protein n=1 Tax=Ixodes ricinus TaxID=34613 RepID=A0A6B0V0F1_IXORI